MSTALAPVASQAVQSPLPMDPRRVLAAFLGGRSAGTLRAYGQDLADFSAFIGASDLDAAAARLLSLPHGEANALALHYRASLLDLGRSPATVNRRLAALRSLVKVGRTLGLIPWTLEVDNVDAEAYRDTRGPGRSGVRALTTALSARQDDKGVRDVAIVRLLYTLGLRRGELVALDLADVDERSSRLAILGKGRRSKVWVSMPQHAAAALALWVARRGRAPGPLFLSLDRATKGHRLSATAVYRIIRLTGESIGIRVRPHGLRHAATTDGLDLAGGDVRAVARFTRHRDIRTVQIYDDSRKDEGGRISALLDAAL